MPDKENINDGHEKFSRRRVRIENIIAEINNSKSKEFIQKRKKAFCMEGGP